MRRFLTYYLPRAAEIAEAYALLGSAPRDTAGMTATGDLIDRLETAFTHYAASLQDAELGKLDIELKLRRVRSTRISDRRGASRSPRSDKR